MAAGFGVKGEEVREQGGEGAGGYFPSLKTPFFVKYSKARNKCHKCRDEKFRIYV